MMLYLRHWSAEGTIYLRALYTYGGYPNAALSHRLGAGHSVLLTQTVPQGSKGVG